MKRLISAILIAVMALTLTGCSDKKETPKNLNKDGIAPYALTDNEKYILKAFGLEGNSQIISFNAPKDTASVRINVYRLGEDDTWKKTDGGGMAISDLMKTGKPLSGTFSMQLREDYAIDYSIIYDNGGASYKAKPNDLNAANIASMKVFLTEFHEIKLGEEIPVALIMYTDSNSMRSHSLEEFSNPSAFHGMLLVQAVTLTFSDKKL